MGKSAGWKIGRSVFGRSADGQISNLTNRQSVSRQIGRLVNLLFSRPPSRVPRPSYKRGLSPTAIKQLSPTSGDATVILVFKLPSPTRDDATNDFVVKTAVA